METKYHNWALQEFEDDIALGSSEYTELPQ